MTSGQTNTILSHTVKNSIRTNRAHQITSKQTWLGQTKMVLRGFLLHILSDALSARVGLRKVYSRQVHANIDKCEQT